MTRVLLLDVMSTLVYDPFYREIPDFFGMSMSELMRVKHPRAWLDFEYGRIDEHDFLDNFFADGRAYDQTGLKRVMFEAYRHLPGALGLLDELQRRGVEMHLVSNYASWYHEIERRLALGRHAAWTFVSCDHGLRKPDRAVYELLLDRIGVAAEDVLFVDDSERNCATAEELGLPCERFRDVAGLRTRLVRDGVL